MGLSSSVVIITSGQPSANPRTVKEAVALASAGFTVTVVYAPLSTWADAFDRALFDNTPEIKWVRAGCHPIRDAWQYKLVRLRRKVNEWLIRRTSLKSSLEKAYVLYSQELSRMASSIKADLYIAHNLGALPAAVKAAAKWQAACGFDAEDYHRGESPESSFSHSLAVQIENRYIPRLDYMTAASPMISEEYQRLFPNKNIVTINNVFSRKYLQPAALRSDGALSLFWFSQSLGPNRGLETIIKAMSTLENLEISLHLIGNCTDAYRSQLISLSSNPTAIHFLDPVGLDDLFKIGARFDVGLATESPYCRNREICLTNKLFSYLLCGNCVLGSDTPAQERFLNEHPEIGLLYRDGDADNLAVQLERLYNDRGFLQHCRKNAHELAGTILNWEKESEKLLKLISYILEK
jgi:glycosyltransferase involved in cell wall biosynthesis